MRISRHKLVLLAILIVCSIILAYMLMSIYTGEEILRYDSLYEMSSSMHYMYVEYRGSTGFQKKIMYKYLGSEVVGNTSTSKLFLYMEVPGIGATGTQRLNFTIWIDNNDRVVKALKHEILRKPYSVPPSFVQTSIVNVLREFIELQKIIYRLANITITRQNISIDTVEGVNASVSSVEYRIGEHSVRGYRILLHIEFNATRLVYKEIELVIANIWGNKWFIVYVKAVYISNEWIEYRVLEL